jgi:hypothetical protein
VQNIIGSLGLFRAGPLTESEFVTAAGRHGTPAEAATDDLRSSVAEGRLEKVGEDPREYGGAPIFGLSDDGRKVVSSEFSAILKSGAVLQGGAVNPSGPISAILGRPESVRSGAGGEPLPMAVWEGTSLNLLPEFWPPSDLPQHTPTDSLRSRREVSWWPWTVPDPCGCVWVKQPGSPYVFTPVRGAVTCAAPDDGLAEPQGVGAVITDGPLITAIMPTADRPHFVQRAIRYFLEQTYGTKELLVVDDGAEPVKALIPADGPVRYLRLEGKHTIGAKMNAGVQAAQGELISQWDDDDWHGPSRMAAQAAPILAGESTITAMQGAPFYQIAADRTWSAPNGLMRMHHMNGVHCGTLMYRRSGWAGTEGYPDLSFFEQTTFLERMLAAGESLKTIANYRYYVQVRHGKNTWIDDVVGIPGWTSMTGMPWLPEEALGFYRSLRG